MRPLVLLVKPVSSACDMRCGYCFYRDVAARRREAAGAMDGDLVDLMVERAFELDRTGSVTFAFQGGEPTLAGLAFFERFMRSVRRRGRGRETHLALQTNGLAIDDAWVSFLGGNGFLVGVSIDGPRALHDRFRPDAHGAGTHSRALAAWRALSAQGVDANVLTVLTDELARHPQQVWRFLDREGVDFVQFIPCLGPLGGGGGGAELTPGGFSSFYRVIARLWLEGLAQGRHRSVALLDNLVLLLGGAAPQQCGMLGSCAPQLVIESDGSVYPCDFYALDSRRCGDIRTDSLADILASAGMRAFLAEAPPRPGLCAACPYLAICGGGCRRQRRSICRDGRCGYRELLDYLLPRLIGRLPPPIAPVRRR